MIASFQLFQVKNGIRQDNAVLYIPGHKGSFRQIDPLARVLVHSELFSIHFNEESTAFDGNLMWAQAHFGNPTFISNSSPVNNMTFHRSGRDSFEPLMAAKKDSTANPKNDQPRYGRRVSPRTASAPILNGGGTRNTLETSISGGAAQRIADEFHEFLLRSALHNGPTPRRINDLLPSHSDMNSFLPLTPLYQRALWQQQQQQRDFSQSGSLPSTASSLCRSPSPYNYDNFRTPKEQDVSAQDFMEFIGQVDEAIDHDSRITATTASETKKTKKEEDCFEGSSQFIFGRSVHDVGCSPDHAVPKLTTYERNTSQARTA